MVFFGILLIALGIGATMYGNAMNSSLREQLFSLFNTGSFNPGSIWIIGGVAAIVIGVLLLLSALLRKR